MNQQVERRLTRDKAEECRESHQDVFTPDGYGGVVAYVFQTRDAVVVSTREHERVWRFSEVSWFERRPAATEYVCGYCGGGAEPAESGIGYVHADTADRVRPGGPGDLVSARHNEAGTPVLACDLVERDDEAADVCLCGVVHPDGKHV